MSELSLPFALPGAQIYGTRTSGNWKSQPGRMDSCNARILFGRTGKFGIPALEPCDYNPTMLAAWHDPHGRTEAAETGGAIHFFIDDYRFERVWTKPAAAFERVDHVGAALTPDFSLWRDMPPAMQIWQTYRARWVGAYWQYHGIEVIPTVSWAEPETYEFAFEGLPENSTLAISTVGVRDDYAGELFNAGLAALTERLGPRLLLCYGPAPATEVPTHEYPTFWQNRRPPPKQRQQTCDSPSAPFQDIPLWEDDSDGR
jgi:hypothetical protein